MKRRKLISLLVVSSLCAAMFTGCGSEPAAENTSAEQTSAESTSAEKPESGETAAAEQAEEAPQETTNISVYIRGLPDTGAIDAVTQALNEYSEEKIGVTVTLSNFESGEYLDRLKMGLAAKEDIDLCWMADYTGLDDFVRQDALLDLTDLLPQYEGLYQVMPEEIWQNAQLYGRNYTVPNYKESFLGTSVMTPVAMADTIKEKYGIDFNAIECNSTMDYEVYEDYILACMAEGVEVPLPFQMQCAFNSINDDYEFTDSYYFVMDKETHKVSLWYETEEYAQHHKKMMDWKEKGIWKEEQIMSDFNHTEIMSSGNYALAGWTTVPDNQAQASTRYGVDVYVKEVTDKVLMAPLGSGWSITAYSEKADACLKWLELLNTDTEFADLFVYGIEGEQYTVDENGIITLISDSGWTNAVWKSTNYNVPSLLSTESPDKKEQYNKLNGEAVNSMLAGFTADFSSVLNENAAVIATAKEYSDLLEYGFYDEEKLAEFIAALKAAGSDKIVEELQRQIDEFFAAK